jgi:glutathione synthase/RimK-type ligase-like ATP-grasp enzyme
MIGIYYEHPHWFAPLFAELDRRGTRYTLLHAEHHRFDPASRPPYGLVFNRMSPSAWQRGHGHTVLYTHHFLAHLERHGVRVVNGTQAFQAETSKALQLSVLRQLGLPYPATRIINDAADAPAAAAELRYPVVVKPNIGGSGAGVLRFDAPEQLAAAAVTGGLELGPDHTALVQEFIPAEEGRITRVEVLGGRYLYAIRVYSSGETFNLCPADVCQTTDGAELVRSACPVDAPRNGLRVEGYEAPPEIARQVERIAGACGIEVGGIEYAVDARDGRLYYYDINALSNFVADAPRVVGFDPFARLADFLEREVR